MYSRALIGAALGLATAAYTHRTFTRNKPVVIIPLVALAFKEVVQIRDRKGIIVIEGPKEIIVLHPRLFAKTVVRLLPFICQPCVPAADRGYEDVSRLLRELGWSDKMSITHAVRADDKVIICDREGDMRYDVQRFPMYESLLIFVWIVKYRIRG